MTNHRRTRTASILAAVAALVMTLLALTGAPATAAPVAPPTPIPPLPAGAVKVAEPHEYIYGNEAFGIEVLHIDMEHSDANGFWFAFKTGSWAPGVREMRRAYQPYGLWCSVPHTKLAYNAWMNIHWCMNDPDDPPFWYSEENTAACRAQTGYPWKIAIGVAPDVFCEDINLNSHNNFFSQLPSQQMDCAPWEDHSLNANGRSKCLSKTYPWMDGKSKPWVPAPDACTGMPAHTNRGTTYVNPANHAPQSGGDGSCTGAAPAPNCTAATAALRPCQATSISPDPDPEPEPTDPNPPTDPEPEQFTATASYTATMTGEATGFATRTASKTRVVWKKKVTVTRKIGGRKYTASAQAKVKKTATATVSALDVATATETRTITASCTAATQAEANQCALDRAKSQAEEKAQTAADAAAYDQASYRAGIQAAEQAKAAAKRKSNQQTAKAAERNKAIKQAKKKAVQKIQTKAKKAKKRR